MINLNCVNKNEPDTGEHEVHTLDCASNNNRIKTMQEWQAEGLPKTLGYAKYHECGGDCSCRLEKV